MTAKKDSFSPQKEIGALTSIQRIVLVFKRAGLNRIVVVCSEDDDSTMKQVANLNVDFLHYRKNAEMLDCVKAGLSYLFNKCASVLITHADNPLFSVETVRVIMSAQGQICIPSYRGSQGHPILLQMEHSPAILSYIGEGGLAGAVRAAGLRRNLVAVEDEGILCHVNNENSYAHLIAGNSLQDSYPDIRIRIIREKVLYSPEVHQLMQLVDETGSIRDACCKMGISVGKARMVLALAAQQLGYPVVDSKRGGGVGGHTVLTEKGRSLMDKYTSVCAAANQRIMGLFDQFFDS
jgi:molybdate transport repressor ModE-like protein